jgi:Flp pilus assembly protein TadG
MAKRRVHCFSENGEPFRLRRSERGSSIVEYGFIVVIFLSLLFGISGFGHALFVYHHLNNAAKEATRYASVRGSTCSNDGSCVASNSALGITGPTTKADVKKYVQNITPPSIDATKLTVTVCGVSDSGACAASTPDACATGNANFVAVNYPSCTVQVQVQYAYNFIFPLIHVAAVNMSSTSDLVIVH